MYRDILEELIQWKDKDDRKILFLFGAKGVGKSYTLNDFGYIFPRNSAIIDLKKQEYIKVFFEENLNKEKLTSILEISSGDTIVKGETLIVIENIDCINNTLETLKILRNQMSEYHIAITASGNENDLIENYPEIKSYVDIRHLYPMTFNEFLSILKQEDYCAKIKNNSKSPITDEDKKIILEYLRKYLFIGGMPSVVQKYIDTRDFEVVADEKERLIKSFIKDFEEISSNQLSDKVKQIWKSIPTQLNKENKKFQFGLVKLTARAREYKEAIDWIVNEKYIFKLKRLKEPLSPLHKHIDEKSFEVFVADVGILTEMYGLSYEQVADEMYLENLFEGAILEQYVWQELRANVNVNELYYWISDATAKIEFVFEDSGVVIPIEVNLRENTKAQSMKVFRKKFKTPMALSITDNSMDAEDGMLKLPLYAIWNL